MSRLIPEYKLKFKNLQLTRAKLRTDIFMQKEQMEQKTSQLTELDE